MYRVIVLRDSSGKPRWILWVLLAVLAVLTVGAAVVLILASNYLSQLPVLLYLVVGAMVLLLIAVGVLVWTVLRVTRRT